MGTTSATASRVVPPPHPAEQFRSAAQQRETATLGIWGFLATEVLFFGGLFVAFTIYRARWPDAFRAGSLELKWFLGGLNTAVLLFSSFFMALAVRAAQQGDNRKVIRHLLVTMALAATFLAVKAGEYFVEFDEGLVPGRTFRAEPPPAGTRHLLTRWVSHVGHALTPGESSESASSGRDVHVQLFMVFYFVMTGIHAAHMLVGIGLMAWLIAAARGGRFSAAWHTPVEVVGLYWHFVDIVWVFLFPVLYLLRNP